MTDDQRKSSALSAAASAAEAVAELLRFAREGDDHPTAFGHVEVVEMLADAMKMAIEVEGPNGDDDRCRIYAALIAYLEGWMR